MTFKIVVRLQILYQYIHKIVVQLLSFSISRVLSSHSHEFYFCSSNWWVELKQEYWASLFLKISSMQLNNCMLLSKTKSEDSATVINRFCLQSGQHSLHKYNLQDSVIIFSNLCLLFFNHLLQNKIVHDGIM